MKILVFGDIHLAGGAAGRLPGIADADPVILSGEPTSCGGAAEVKDQAGAGIRDRCTASR